MKNVFSGLQNVLLRISAIVFIVGLSFCGMSAFSGNTMLAQADTVKTPEGIYYKGTPDNNDGISRQVDNARRNIRDTVENAKDNFKADRSSSRTPNIGETVTTPEGTYYKGTPNNNDTDTFGKAKGGLKGVAENIKEKLNLDEPLPRSTKQFLRSNEEKVKDTVEPITGNREGYYQTPAR